MATRSEQHRAEEQRRGPRDTKKNKKANRSKPGSPPKDRLRAKTRAGAKADGNKNHVQSLHRAEELQRISRHPAHQPRVKLARQRPSPCRI